MNIDSALGDYLKKNDLKNTAVRIAAAEAASSLKGHFDTEELLVEAKKKDPKVSRASVYRAVPLLIKAGIIKESIQKDGRRVYESCTGGHYRHHDHMICDKCGAIIEFEDYAIERHQQMMAERYGFQLREHRLVLWGLCKNCRQKEK